MGDFSSSPNFARKGNLLSLRRTQEVHVSMPLRLLPYGASGCDVTPCRFRGPVSRLPGVPTSLFPPFTDHPVSQVERSSHNYISSTSCNRERPTDSYSCARDAEYFGWFCAHTKLKTRRFALGPKNVHQPWPLALNVSQCVRTPLSQLL